jgi:hypothetical protein
MVWVKGSLPLISFGVWDDAGSLATLGPALSETKEPALSETKEPALSETKEPALSETKG